ncbi:hypothetical protein NCAS_0D01500 [Naumovozyma castellii]|uniref:Uncharacterized protein n=1 Tax=Naumovozyma castellii TaxID=27288 RepID=G0VDU2_NAUCA|nr:hypothetical protein NCAS_0D01500 [Naumovozyma castellii CBS 4309]CCC69731.1 hypothetical protein NCAS_0D01500 [Naumovozyma castellii CBS 4309]
MKLDPKVYQEATRAAKTPHFKYLMLGLVCAATLPTSVYMQRNPPVKTIDKRKSPKGLNSMDSELDDFESFPTFSSIL